MGDEVWVLGATGRSGRDVAQRLGAAGVPLVLTGRDGARLEEVASRASAAGGVGARVRVVVGSLGDVLQRLAVEDPAVVVSTVGPFTRTAPLVVGALPPGCHYVDLSNELEAADAVLALHDRAAAGGSTLVTGAGFGVLAVEAPLLALCAGRPAPAAVRVDAISSVAVAPGTVGPVLAATVAHVLATGGRQVRGGRLVRSRTGSDPERSSTPDGDEVLTASGATGELLAAWRASGAERVVAASALAPSSPLVRACLPAVEAALRVPGASALLVRVLERLPLRASERPRAHSWGRARAVWADGEQREAWLRTGDGGVFTAAVAAEVARRLHAGLGRPGAHTPGALFGPDLAEAAGADLLLTVPGPPA